METNCDVVIIGCGVAGLGAGPTHVRARRNMIIVDVADTSFGPFVETDPTDKTNVEGLWAAGRVVNVPAKDVCRSALDPSRRALQIWI